MRSLPPLAIVVIAIVAQYSRAFSPRANSHDRGRNRHHYLSSTTVTTTASSLAFALQSSSSSSSLSSLNTNFDDNDGPLLQDLEIIDVEEGIGEKIAKFESIVTIKYTGRFYNNNTEFDASMISFKLGYGKVLEGCDKGIRGMRVGGTRILKIPSRLGFGAEGFTGPLYTIPPNTDLEYTVELTSVSSGPMAEAAANMGIGLDPNTVYLK